MQKLMLALLVGTIALAPAIAAAQTGGSGSKPAGSSTSSGKSGGTTSSSGSSTSPAASPSGTSSDLSKTTTKAECEKAGGMWQAAANKCEKKK